MKKIFIAVIFLLSLSGCGSNIYTTKEPNIINEYNVYEVQTAMTEVVKNVESSCIGILNKATDGNNGTGSGVIFKKEDMANGYYKYYAITNYHVVEGFDYLKVYLGRNKYGDIFHQAQYIGGNEDEDIAVVCFNCKMELGVCDMALSDNLCKGQFVIAIGCPLGLTLFNSVTTGVISNVDNEEIQHDAAINPGNSGGALFNLDGKLIGINTYKYVSVSVDGIGFALNIVNVNKLVNKIMNGEDDQNILIGISVAEYQSFINNNSVGIENVPSNLLGGLVVQEVVPGSNGYKAGLMQYDVIVKVNEEDIYIIDDLSNILKKSNIGDSLNVSLYRNNELMDVVINLE